MPRALKLCMSMMNCGSGPFALALKGATTPPQCSLPTELNICAAVHCRVGFGGGTELTPAGIVCQRERVGLAHACLPASDPKHGLLVT